MRLQCLLKGTRLPGQRETLLCVPIGFLSLWQKHPGKQLKKESVRSQGQRFPSLRRGRGQHNSVSSHDAQGRAPHLLSPFSPTPPKSQPLGWVCLLVYPILNILTKKWALLMSQVLLTPISVTITHLSTPLVKHQQMFASYKQLRSRVHFLFYSTPFCSTPVAWVLNPLSRVDNLELWTWTFPLPPWKCWFTACSTISLVFFNVGDWTLSLVHARQRFYQLNYISSPFWFWFEKKKSFKYHSWVPDSVWTVH